MKFQTDVKNVEILNNSSIELKKIMNRSVEISNNLMTKCKELLYETKEEKINSRFLLEEAKKDEKIKHGIMIGCIGEPCYPSANSAYQEAVAKRKRMEKRYKMACECVNEANESLNETSRNLRSQLLSLREIVSEGSIRLFIAYKHQKEYLEIKSQINVEKLNDSQKKLEEEKIITPDKIRNRMTLSEKEIHIIMFEEYFNNEAFRNKIDRYKSEIKENEENTKLKIKKNLSGEIGELIVKNAFLPFAESIETQNRTYLEEGSYTKTDLILKNLKKPIIMGRGQGAGVKEGNDIAIEVKTGTKEYIKNQKEHMLTQIKGHSGSKMSLIICSRDLNDLADDINLKFRNDFKDNGTRVYAMLNTKEEIDNACISFVKKMY